MFLGYIHYFRALAIFFIVAGHSIDVFLWEGSEELEKILRIFFSNGSVLFVFIAGYLFQHLSIKYTPKRYFVSKLKNVLCPYVLISIPAILVFTIIQERETVWEGFYQNSLWEQVFLFYITGMHLAPFWFIPMISIFYLISPLLVKEDKRQVIYFFLPFFILISCYIGRGLPIQSFIHFFSVYLLGMYCSRYKDTINDKLKKLLFLVPFFIFVIILGIFELLYMQGTMTYINYLQKIFMSLFFLGILIRFNSKLNSKYINIIANTSFGIFFIHSYFLTAGKLGYKSLFLEQANGNIFIWLAAVLIVLNICVFFVFFTSKVFGKYSRYMIGS